MEKNTPASVALWTGVAVIVLLFVGFCLGFIPILNLLTILILPLVFVGDFVAIAAGFVGLKRAKELGGIGKGSALGGLLIGIGHLLLLVVGFVLALLFGGLAFLTGMLQNL